MIEVCILRYAIRNLFLRIKRFLLATGSTYRNRRKSIPANHRRYRAPIICDCSFVRTHIAPRFNTHSRFYSRERYSSNDRGRFSHLQRTHRGLFRGTNRSATNYRSDEWALTAASLTCNHRRGDKSFYCH